ncbi:hypothetical protein, partial [Klebsiella pneumoniae]|uniref:hypothetical protein n=1 Tax=Klebsiella pneumoniae TaxID=573 RepID=UPI002731629C
PTTTPSASMWIHFFSTSAGFSEAVVLFSMMRVLEDEKRGPNQMDRAEAGVIEGRAPKVNVSCGKDSNVGT